MPKKSILQTNSTHGFYKQGDKHPFIPERFFTTYKKNTRGREVYEEWSTAKALNKGKIARLKYCAQQQAKKRGGKPKQLKLKTNDPPGTFKYGDPHPTIPDRFFKNHAPNKQQR